MKIFLYIIYCLAAEYINSYDYSININFQVRIQTLLSERTNLIQDLKKKEHDDLQNHLLDCLERSLNIIQSEFETLISTKPLVTALKELQACLGFIIFIDKGVLHVLNNTNIDFQVSMKDQLFYDAFSEIIESCFRDLTVIFIQD